MPSEPILVARPPNSEWLIVLLIYPVAAAMVAGAVSFGVDRIYPDFLTDNFAANRLRMGAIFLVALAALVGWTISANRTRYYRLFADRLAVGRSESVSIAFSAITKIRVGAPIPGSVRRVVSINKRIGKLSPMNRYASRKLEHSYANTVVIDEGNQHTVINLGTVANGPEFLRRFLEFNQSKVQMPALYSEQELAIFGRFRPNVYTGKNYSR